MKNSRSIHIGWIITACMLISSLILVSCAPAAPASTAKPAAVSSDPKYGGTLRLSVEVDVTHLDPSIGMTRAERAFAKYWGDTLVTWEGKDDETAKLAPCLAKSWDISPDGLTVTFKLREGVKWQNIAPVNGREFTSEDVKFFFEHQLDPNFKGRIKGYLNTIKNIETPDKYTVVLKLKAPYPGLLNILPYGPFAMQAREVVEKYGDYGTVIVGTGPFIYVPEESQKGSRWIFKKNPDYWQKGKPYVDRLEVTYIKDESMALAQFRTGQLDRLWASKTVADEIKKTNPDASILPRIGIVGSGLYFGMSQSPDTVGAVKVRQAIRYAIDTQGLVQAVTNGAGSSTSFMAPFIDGAPQLSDLPKQDIAKAKALLVEAGFPNGFKTTILQDMSKPECWGGQVEPIVAMLKQVGIDAEIKQMDKAAIQGVLRSGKFDIASHTVVSVGPPDADYCLSNYETGAPYNFSRYSNKQFDELLIKERQLILQPEQRKAVVKQMQDILNRDLPAIPTFYSWGFHVVQPWIKGWENAADPNYDLGVHNVKYVWIDKK